MPFQVPTTILDLYIVFISVEPAKVSYLFIYFSKIYRADPFQSSLPKLTGFLQLAASGWLSLGGSPKTCSGLVPKEKLYISYLVLRFACSQSILAPAASSRRAAGFPSTAFSSTQFPQPCPSMPGLPPRSKATISWWVPIAISRLPRTACGRDGGRESICIWELVFYNFL